jgi:hypothetical protein
MPNARPIIMASERAIVAAFKILSRAFAGVVDKERVDVYCAALEDLSDTELATAVTHVVKTHTGEFIPPPAVIRKAVAPAPVAVDATAVIRKIEKLATYNPNVGMVYPRVEDVRTALGDAAAYAYAAAGGPRVFSDNETSRDIATREFQKAMADAANLPGSDLPIIGVTNGPLALPGGQHAAD